MEGYYSAHTAKCWACTARESEAADQHGKGVLIGVVDDSYTDGYEPRSVVAAHQTSAPRDQPDQADNDAQDQGERRGPA